jgi:hypothetical protein
VTVRDRIVEDLAKHYPGGKDHDQDNHGKRGNVEVRSELLPPKLHPDDSKLSELTVERRNLATEIGKEGDTPDRVERYKELNRLDRKIDEILDARQALRDFEADQEPDDSYRIQHQPNDSYGAPAHDLSVLVNEDIYTHPEWYFSMYESYNREGAKIIQRIRGNPDAKVEIFRAVPADVTEINDGDWVTTSKRYAERHGDGVLQDWKSTPIPGTSDYTYERVGPGYRILSKTVTAKELMWPADSMVEFGWFPNGPFAKNPDLTLEDIEDFEKHYPGGKDHDQSRHGRRKGGGKTTRKAPKWNPLKPKPLSYHDEIYDHIIVGGDKPGNERALQKDQVVNDITHRIMKSEYRDDVVAFATAVFKPKGNHPLYDIYGNYPPNFNAHLRYKLSDSMSDEMRDRVYVKNFVDNAIDKWADMNRYQIEAVNRAVAEVFGVPNYNYHAIVGINEQVMEELYSATTKTKKPIQNVWLEADSGIPGPHPMFGPQDSTNPDYTIQYLFQTDEEAMSYVSQNPGIPVKSNESGDYFEGGTYGVTPTEPIRAGYKNTPHVDPEVGRSAYRGLVHAVYENTQETINRRKEMHGLPKGNVVLFRGLAGRKNSKWLDQKLDAWVGAYGKEWKKTQAIMGNVMDEETFPGVIYSNVEIQGRPVASWSASINTAMGTFSGEGTTLAVSVPTEAIFSTAETGFGAMAEDEVLLIDSGKNVVTAIPSEQAQPWENVLKEVYRAGYGDATGGSTDTRNAKIAWTGAFLSEFNHRGIEVDLNHSGLVQMGRPMFGPMSSKDKPAPERYTVSDSAREEIVTNVISQWDGNDFGWTDDKDEFMEEVLAS